MMLTEVLQDRAVQYVSGAMTAAERANFEVLLEFHLELRALVDGLQEVTANVTMAEVKHRVAPPAALKARILGAADAPLVPAQPEGLVVADAGGLIHWVNPGFTMMCGYTLEELKGRKPGHLLQGPETDPAAVERIRASLRARRDCRETLVNYHKNGTRYRVDLSIAAIRDDAGEPLWFVAREWKLSA